MQKLLIELIDTVNLIDRKIISDFHNSDIPITAEMIHLKERLEYSVRLLKTFKDMADVYAADNS